MNYFYGVSTDKWTCGVVVTDGRIVHTPPLLRKFMGQPLDNLRRWASRQRGFEMVEIQQPHAGEE